MAVNMQHLVRSLQADNNVPEAVICSYIAQAIEELKGNNPLDDKYKACLVLCNIASMVEGYEVDVILRYYFPLFEPTVGPNNPLQCFEAHNLKSLLNEAIRDNHGVTVCLLFSVIVTVDSSRLVGDESLLEDTWAALSKCISASKLLNERIMIARVVATLAKRLREGAERVALRNNLFKVVNFQCYLRMNAETGVCSRILQYALDHVNDAVDTIKQMAKTSLLDILQCHLKLVGEASGASELVSTVALRLMSSLTSGNMAAMTSMLKLVPVKVFLVVNHLLPQQLLQATREPRLQAQASILYTSLCSKDNETDAIECRWLSPLLVAFQTSEESFAVYQQILGQLLKKYPEKLLNAMKDKSGNALLSSTALSGLIFCCKFLRSNGCLNNADVDHCLSDQIRMDAFSYVCVTHKTSESVTEKEFVMLKRALPYSLHEPQSATRDRLNVALKKFFRRMKDSWTTVDFVQLDLYKSFVSWFVELCVGNLAPNSAYGCRTSAITFLSSMAKEISQGGSQTESFAYVQHLFTKEVLKRLFCGFYDTFDENKQKALEILTIMQQRCVQAFQPEEINLLFDSAKSMLSSTKPQDCSSAAFVFKFVLLLAPNPLFEISHSSSNQSHERIIALLRLLTSELELHLEVGRRSVVEAAMNKPFYPPIHCIRVLFSALDSSAASADCGLFVSHLLPLLFEVATLVTPVVGHSTPEGHCMGDLTLLDKVTPEVISVCCWRSVKEISLLFGILCEKGLSCQEPFLEYSQVVDIGNFYIAQLLGSKHRGAFELASAGFSVLTKVLWSVKNGPLNALPKMWLEELFADLEAPGDRLCSTRRSAGVPFYVQALLSSESKLKGRTNLVLYMQRLLDLARSSPSVSTKIHARNILRALYRDSHFGDDVTSYVAEGVQLAIEGYSSPLWEIRNASTMLFSALIVRIFGVKRGKDDLSRKNCLTGRLFFCKYPTLFEFLLQRLENTLHHKRPSEQGELYPILLLLAKLYPSSLEGTDSTKTLEPFVPLVLRCGSSSIYRIRLMAARALKSLVTADEMEAVVKELVKRLVSSAEANEAHGILLQLNELLDDSAISIDRSNVATKLLRMNSLLWSRCYSLRYAMLSVLHKLMRHSSPSEQRLVEAYSRTIHELAGEHFSCSEIYHPEFTFYIKLLCEMYLELNFSEREMIENIHEDFSHLLRHPISSVRDCALDYVAKHSAAIHDVKEGWKIVQQEDNLETLEKGLMCLAKLAGSGIKVYSGDSLKQHCDAVCSLLCHPKESVRCSAFEYSVSPFLELASLGQSVTLVEKWVTCLGDLASEDSVLCQMCAAKVISRSKPLLFTRKLGKIEENLWTILFALLQNEEPDVRLEAAKVLDSNEQVESECVSTLVLETAVCQFVDAYNDVTSCADCLVHWILISIETSQSTTAGVLVFDKEEQNLYRDSRYFCNLLLQQLQVLVESFSKSRKQFSVHITQEVQRVKLLMDNERRDSQLLRTLCDIVL